MADEIIINLGKKIKNHRESKKITLKELAAKTSVTPSLLSQIENGKAAPSLTTLKSIADYFEIPIGILFETRTKNVQSPVIRKNSHKKILAEGNIRHFLLSQGLDDFEFLMIEFPPASNTGVEPYSHEGSECAYLVKGELHIELDGCEHVLQEGDSIIFESHKKHRIINSSNETAVVLWVDSKPWFFTHK